MGLFNWFSRKNNEKVSSALTQGSREFLEGKKDLLTSVDIEPEGAERYAEYERAMALKKDGKFSDAAKLLLKSCEPPSIYKGHYRELFKIWRQFNRDGLKTGRYQEVVDRVLMMKHLDEAMIQEMLRYWSVQQKRELSSDYFDSDRNLLVSDAKALKKAAEALKQDDNVQFAIELIEHFPRNREV